MNTLKSFFITWYARTVAEYCRESSSDTCKMLLAAIEKQGYGAMPYNLRGSIERWMSVSSNWVDKYVLAVELEHEAEACAQAAIVTYITQDWKDPHDVESDTYGDVAKNMAQGLVNSMLHTKTNIAARTLQQKFDAGMANKIRGGY